MTETTELYPGTELKALTVGIIGGTGAQGTGLGYRLAKAGFKVILAEERLAMTELAVLSNEKFECSDIEVTKKETSYSLHTLEYLMGQYPEDSFYLIIGMDNYLTFHLWKEPKKILELTTLVVMNRPGYAKQINKIIGTDNIVFVDVPSVDISSSEIRQRIREKRSIHTLVPDNVEEYIVSRGLYL